MMSIARQQLFSLSPAFASPTAVEIQFDTENPMINHSQPTMESDRHRVRLLLHP